MIWQITPLGRPWMARRVVEQFAAQRYPDKRLCLVLNGPHWGEQPDQLCEWLSYADLLLASEPGKPAALNHAVHYLRGRGADMVVVRDDDDHYAPGGLDEFARLLPKHDIVGQSRHWVWDGSSLWLFNQYGDDQPGKAELWGGNFGFHLSDAIEFPEQRVGECHAWAKAMIERGAKVWFKSRHHACLDRTQPDHLWDASFTMVRNRSNGSAVRFPGWSWPLIEGRESLEHGEIVPRPTTEEAHAAELERMMGEPNGLAETTTHA